VGWLKTENSQENLPPPYRRNAATTTTRRRPDDAVSVCSTPARQQHLRARRGAEKKGDLT